MTTAPACPRCLGPLRPPDLWSNSWSCERHGDVVPYRSAVSSREDTLGWLRKTAGVPVWAPAPAPIGWFGSGVAWAGDERGEPRATALAAGGPSPLGGPADMVIVAEEPRIGLGARLAGLDGPEPDGTLTDLPEAKVEAAGHPSALWAVACPPDRAAFVGEALGVWLWLIFWPADAAMLLLEHLVLHDLRDSNMRDTSEIGTEVVFGSWSPYLGPSAPGNPVP